MKRFFQNNGILILIAAMLLAAVTFAMSFFVDGAANPVANLVGILTTPVKGAVASVAQWAEGVYNYSFQYEQLREENERLKKEIADLEAKAREGEAASRENEELRAVLGLREKRADFVYESARVVSYASSNWAATITISKGSAHGVEENDCVIDSSGTLVGVVSEVGLTWSTVITVVDANLEMGALVARTESAAIIEGDFALMVEGKLKLTYLPESTQLLAGDQVLTSGKGGIYPSGLVVGTIEEIRTDASGMSRYAVVVPAAKISELIEVFVIKDFDIVE